MYESGLSIRQVAEAMGLANYAWTRELILDSGATLRGRGLRRGTKLGPRKKGRRSTRVERRSGRGRR